MGEATSVVAGQVIELAVTDSELTSPEAAALTAGIERLRLRLLRGHPELFPDHYWVTTSTYSDLGRFERRAELVRTGLLPPVLPITAAGTLVGLAVVAAAAVFWVQRRRQERTVLASHGAGPAGLGGKAVLETLPAVVLGAAGGWAAAWALVSWAGPSPILAAGALPRAGLAAAATAVVGLALVGGLAAGRARIELVLRVLREHAYGGAAVLVASHDPDVIAAADRVITMADGRIAADTSAPVSPR